MKKNSETRRPDWISAEDACKWLGVDYTTLFKWRTSKGLHWTTMGGGKTVMYDRNQINEILYNNSTYAVADMIK